MKSSSNIQNLIVTFIVDEVGTVAHDELEIDSKLFAEGILDSIAIMQLIAHIENALDIKIPAKDLLPRNFMTIEAMINYLTGS